jgi:hypothetical protein
VRVDVVRAFLAPEVDTSIQSLEWHAPDWTLVRYVAAHRALMEPEAAERMIHVARVSAFNPTGVAAGAAGPNMAAAGAGLSGGGVGGGVGPQAGRHAFSSVEEAEAAEAARWRFTTQTGSAKYGGAATGGGADVSGAAEAAAAVAAASAQLRLLRTLLVTNASNG